MNLGNAKQYKGFANGTICLRPHPWVLYDVDALTIAILLVDGDSENSDMCR